MKITLTDIIVFFAGLGILVSVLLLIGTAGAIECDSITVKDSIPRVIICLIILVVSVFGITKFESEENAYDRL